MRRRGSRLSSLLMFFLLLALGFNGRRADRELETYYNDFVRSSYKEAILGGWNGYIEAVNAEGSDAATGEKFVSTKLIPAMETWSKRASDLVPPPFADDFHNQYTLELQMLAKHSKQLLAELQAGESPSSTESFEKMAASIKRVDQAVLKLKADLRQERGFSFGDESGREGAPSSPEK